MKPTLKDVAVHAGVSTATVSRVINDDPRISPATRERVRREIDRLHYTVNTVARNLKMRRTRTIALVTPEIANTFFMQVAEGAEDLLTDKGYSMIVVNTRESIAGEQRAIDLVIEKQVDGCIVIPSQSDGNHFNRLRARSVPVVLVDRLVTDFPCDAVLTDNVEAAHRMISALWEEGRRRFGFIGGQHELTSAAERYRGFRQALLERDYTPHPEHVAFGDFHRESGYTLLDRLLSTPHPPSTIMIANQFMQVGALQYAVAHRQALPPDFFLAAFDNPDAAAVAGIPGRLVVQPIDDLGRQAARIILSRITKGGPNRFTTVRLPARIIPTADHPRY